jgi:hypothetical protein
MIEENKDYGISLMSIFKKIDNLLDLYTNRSTHNGYTTLLENNICYILKNDKKECSKDNHITLENFKGMNFENPVFLDNDFLIKFLLELIGIEQYVNKLENDYILLTLENERLKSK